MLNIASIHSSDFLEWCSGERICTIKILLVVDTSLKDLSLKKLFISKLKWWAKRWLANTKCIAAILQHLKCRFYQSLHFHHFLSRSHSSRSIIKFLLEVLQLGDVSIIRSQLIITFNVTPVCHCGRVIGDSMVRNVRQYLIFPLQSHYIFDCLPPSDQQAVQLLWLSILWKWWLNFLCTAW